MKWEEVVDFLFAFEVELSRAKAKGLVSFRQECLMRDKIRPLSHWACINSPRLGDNDFLKKEIDLAFLNDELARYGVFVRSQ